MKLVKEDINFERGQDPKKAMEIGNTKDRDRFLELFPRDMRNNERESWNTSESEMYKKIKNIINNKAIVKFYKYEDDGSQYVSVELPPSEYNFFVFNCLMNLFDSYRPKNVMKERMISDNIIELLIY